MFLFLLSTLDLPWLTKKNSKNVKPKTKKNKFIQLNKSLDSKNNEAITKKENKNDWRKASLTEWKIKACFIKTNLTKNPIIAPVPIRAKDSDA